MSLTERSTLERGNTIATPAWQWILCVRATLMGTTVRFDVSLSHGKSSVDCCLIVRVGSVVCPGKLVGSLDALGKSMRYGCVVLWKTQVSNPGTITSRKPNTSMANLSLIHCPSQAVIVPSSPMDAITISPCSMSHLGSGCPLQRPSHSCHLGHLPDRAKVGRYQD